MCVWVYVYPEWQKVIALDEKTHHLKWGRYECMQCHTKRTSSKAAIHIQLLKPVDIVPFRRKSVYPGAFHIHFRQSGTRRKVLDGREAMLLLHWNRHSH